MIHRGIIVKIALWEGGNQVQKALNNNFTIWNVLYYYGILYDWQYHSTLYWDTCKYYKTYLRFDVVFFTILIKPSNINLAIKMTNITDDGIFLHLHEVFFGDDSTATSWCNKDLSLGGGFFHGNNFISYEKIKRKIHHHQSLWSTLHSQTSPHRQLHYMDTSLLTL